ncbi:hypothetical protein [Xanthomonas sacchari]|uniref:hypothetical protein n=1 Tax=Xanthomonas sacchari TaxID=56458 RepID=UPI003D2F8321
MGLPDLVVADPDFPPGPSSFPSPAGRARRLATRRRWSKISRVRVSAHEGFSVTTADGRRARLAVVDDEGIVVASGAAIERAAFEAAVLAYRNFLQGQGHLRVHARALELCPETLRANTGMTGPIQQPQSLLWVNEN